MLTSTFVGGCDLMSGTEATKRGTLKVWKNDPVLNGEIRAINRKNGLKQLIRTLLGW